MSAETNVTYKNDTAVSRGKVVAKEKTPTKTQNKKVTLAQIKARATQILRWFDMRRNETKHGSSDAPQASEALWLQLAVTKCLMQARNKSKDLRLIHDELLKIENEMCYAYGNKSERKLALETMQQKWSCDLTCKNCKGQLRLQTLINAYICTNCGTSTTAGVRTRFKNVKEANMCIPRNENFSWTRKYTYKRLNHLRDTMQRMRGEHQAKTDVFDSVCSKVKEYICRANADLKLLTPSTIRDTLKALHLNKYYGMSVAICARLNPHFEPVGFTSQQMVEINVVFLQLESVYKDMLKSIGSNRKNFMSYPYVLYRICELIGYQHENLLNSTRLLLSRNLLVQQDFMWTKMMEKLKWKKQQPLSERFSHLNYND